MSTSRILIVDDEDTFRESTRALVEQAGYACDSASNTAAAKDLLRDTAYDLVISDIRMPTNENLEFVRGLGRAENSIPVIIVTGYPSIPTAIAAIDLSVCGYLVKPFEIEDLLKQIDRCLKARRQFRAARDQTRLLLNNCRNVLESVEELVGGAEPTGSHSHPTPARGPDRTDATALVQVLKETIDVLEKTKSSFRSRELAQLRHKLEQVVETETSRDID